MIAAIEKIAILVMLFICSIQDIKTKRISLWIVILTSVITLVLIPFRPFKFIDRVGGLMVGGMILFVSKITGGKIGMGDGFILCATGISLGLWANLELLSLSLFLASIISIILLVLKLVDRKKSIPFVPFICLGYIGIIMLDIFI